MSHVLKRIFLEHPRSVDETYGQHMQFAGGFAWSLFKASMAAFVHALVPCLFEKTAGRMIGEMHERLTSRN